MIPQMVTPTKLILISEVQPRLCPDEACSDFQLVMVSNMNLLTSPEGCGRMTRTRWVNSCSHAWLFVWLCHHPDLNVFYYSKRHTNTHVSSSCILPTPIHILVDLILIMNLSQISPPSVQKIVNEANGLTASPSWMVELVCHTITKHIFLPTKRNACYAGLNFYYEHFSYNANWPRKYLMFFQVVDSQKQIKIFPSTSEIHSFLNVPSNK